MCCLSSHRHVVARRANSPCTHSAFHHLSPSFSHIFAFLTLSCVTSTGYCPWNKIAFRAFFVNSKVLHSLRAFARVSKSTVELSWLSFSTSLSFRHQAVSCFRSSQKPSSAYIRLNSLFLVQYGLKRSCTALAILVFIVSSNSHQSDPIACLRVSVTPSRSSSMTSLSIVITVVLAATFAGKVDEDDGAVV